MDRRGFLRMLGLGAAAAVAAPIIKPKSFFSFFGTGEIWKPTPQAIKLECSIDRINWIDYTGDAFSVKALSDVHGLIDAGMILGKDDILDTGSYRADFFSRYVRLHTDSPSQIYIGPSLIT